MAEDREIMRELWDGRVPVTFTLAEEEIDSEQPDPVYLMVPRITYFPLVTEKITKHFTKYISEENQGEVWLEFEGQPLKWHYPVGVLYDLYNSDSSLPWRISVHFQEFPEDELLHCGSKDVVESHFISTIKEADSLKHRGQVINGMQKKDHKQLWNGLIHDRFEQFWSVNKKLMESSGDDMFKYIPFRIYMVDKHYVQSLFRPMTDEGQHYTLKDLLKASVPEFFNSDDIFTMHAVIHGVEPPLHTPILWLSEHFSFPDNFLHICVLSTDSKGYI
ncbi:hypothetical protein FSP39_006880 [Pinctada imbricata]|uniref:Autophagy protein 5 n=1 Tax=Pinctada imbricata TaxID=66713 RepID=A0AA89BV35_PINIB|nr:hypothetical protein FSP39_006880 [Pinctada imbricata]